MSRSIIEDGIEFDSGEELEFYQWVKEAKDSGFITKWSYHPDPFILSEKKSITEVVQLKTKVKTVEKHLLHPHQYTPDFIIFPTDLFNSTFKHKLISTSPDNSLVIDIKGSFQRFDGQRSFSINQKWVMEKYNVYINKVTPETLFKSTWVPESVRYTPKTKKLRSKYKNIKTLNEILVKK